MNWPEFERRKMKVSAAFGDRRTSGALFAGMLKLVLSMGLSGCKETKVVAPPEPPAAPEKPDTPEKPEVPIPEKPEVPEKPEATLSTPIATLRAQSWGP
jgi:hypothetical protein